MTQPRALFLDIDGTILRSDHTLSERVRNAVMRISEAGTLVCLATGRSWEALRPLYKRLGLSGPTICYNGAMVVEGPDGTVVFEKDMDENAARAAITEARRCGLELVAYRHSELLFENRGPEVEAYLVRVAVPGRVVDFDTIRPLELTKCICIGEPDILKPLKTMLEERFSGDELTCTYSERRFLEMMGGGIDKGRGLVQVCRLHGIDPVHTVAMGDGWNDLTLLEAAGDAWVMGGAPEDLKSRFPADRIAADSNSDGAALVIEAMLAERDTLLSTGPREGLLHTEKTIR